MADELGNKMYEFDAFRLDPTHKVLRKLDGTSVPLTRKVFEVLLVLVERKGELVTKDELMQRVWTDSFVEEANLTQTISVLRKSLGENPGDHRYILTEPGLGYRFVARVKEISETATTQVKYGLSGPNESSLEETDGFLTVHDTTDSTPPKFNADQAAEKSSHKTRNVVIALAGTALLGSLSATYFLRPQANSSSAVGDVHEIRSIAVLPFKAIGRDDENPYAGLGMTETLTIKLSKIKKIVVRRTSAVLRYADTPSDPITIGNELKVDALLDGSVQTDGERVRVSVRLVRVSDGSPLWAETFDDQYTNLFEVQDSISEKVARALTLELTGEEKLAVKKRYTNNLEADQLYQKGRFFWNKRTRDGFLKSIELFEQAIQKDANYALAYTGLADSYHLLGDYSYLSPQDSILKAKESALEALELDNTLGEAHTSLAYAKFLYDWEWQAAENSFKRSLELNPNYATAHQWYAEYLIAMGRMDAALVEIERARNLDPQSPALVAVTCWMHYIARDYDQAIQYCRSALEMDANFYPAHFWIGQAAEKKGDPGLAIAAYEKALGLSPNSPEVLASLGHAYALTGQNEKARQVLGQLSKWSRQSYVSSYLIALVYAELGKEDRAMTWLEKGSVERSRAMPFLNVDPMMDSLRSDPRFQQILTRMKFD